MGPSTILYSRMWTFLFLYILGINFCQADNSTQMLYAKLIIDKSAIVNITSMLKNFTYNNTVVEAPVMTTVCTNGTGSKKCGCKPGYRWNDTFCQSNPKCCGNATCTLDKTANAKCVSNTAVTITGSLTLQGSTYVDCLEDITNPKYEKCSDGLLTRMKTEYSTLRGFDFLNITRFRIGSVIADFKIIIASSIDSQALINNSIKIGQILSASLNMETSGLVNLEMPLMPVPYGATNQVIRCTTKEDLKTDPQWRIINSKGQYDITTGTVSTVDTSSRTDSTVNLRNVTELWNGEYSCIYHQTGNCTTSGCAVNILNKASAQLDVALLPNIDVFTEPSFPRCKTENDILQAKAKCEINNSTEPYNVTWDGKRQLETQSK
ncbi:adhesion G protein-coupled receptor F5 [Oreochromis niloticus]|uniref:adhesion G protein-coupled receptor F5 n=1 Tax=Oreochromis niloticus TaxID=8128 RepID=UPI000904B169|nr:adhesion G protein-coupled receptor F5 [Oreochromis niloticus]